MTARARISSYFDASVSAFLEMPTSHVLGRIVTAAQDIDETQKSAWIQIIEVLKTALASIDGHLFLEFDVPRLGSRIDAVVTTCGIVFPIEFKVGETGFLKPDIFQAWDYALDLKNFHAGSHEVPILPILVATASDRSDTKWSEAHADGVRPPVCTNATGIPFILAEGIRLEQCEPFDAESWGRSPYHPTPTIIQAAKALYASHTVEAIARSESGENLTVTSARVHEIIESTRSRGGKAIIFVTGVPGAGKTLVGLNVATQRSDGTPDRRAVFLSGNQPLVAVLTEALIRDELARARAAGDTTVRRGDVEQKVQAFIQIIHRFRDEGIRHFAAPHDHVAIFDEAQRAWDRQHTSAFMKRKKGIADFNQSEPEFLVGYLDRHDEWAVVVCLVGGGQEIHDGEVGIGEWFNAIRDHFPHWQIYISDQLDSTDPSTREALATIEMRHTVVRDKSLHLAVSMRSFRAERVSGFIGAVLDLEPEPAGTLFERLRDQYPLVLTRDLELAKSWIRRQARGTEQFGLVASSQAMRLKPHAIDIRVKVNPVNYFLGKRSDVRSSWYLEDAATEFQVQGLELDWACVNWDADLRLTDDGWSCHRFRGKAWQNVNVETRRRYTVNAYRVLLTRARQGMVIFVPPGDSADHTRLPKFYDGTYNYLNSLGIPVLM